MAKIKKKQPSAADQVLAAAQSVGGKAKSAGAKVGDRAQRLANADTKNRNTKVDAANYATLLYDKKKTWEDGSSRMAGGKERDPDNGFGRPQKRRKKAR